MLDSTATAASATASLADRVTTAIASSPYVPGNGLRIEAADGAIRIHGQVGTFFEKQMAQEVARRLDGVERVENLLEVRWL